MGSGICHMRRMRGLPTLTALGGLWPSVLRACVCVAPARTKRDELGHLQLLLQRVDALPRVDQPHVVQHVGMPEDLHHRRSQALGHDMAVPHPGHPLLSLAHLLLFLPNAFTCVSPSVPGPRAASSVT